MYLFWIIISLFKKKSDIDENDDVLIIEGESDQRSDESEDSEDSVNYKKNKKSQSNTENRYQCE